MYGCSIFCRNDFERHFASIYLNAFPKRPSLPTRQWFEACEQRSETVFLGRSPWKPFYSISRPNFTILLTLGCSLILWWFFYFNVFKNFVYYAVCPSGCSKCMSCKKLKAQSRLLRQADHFSGKKHGRSPGNRNPSPATLLAKWGQNQPWLCMITN